MICVGKRCDAAITGSRKRDPLGRRVSTTDIGGTVYHAYGGIHCVADLAPDGTLLRSYTWGAGVDNLLAVTFYSGTATNTLYAVTDPLGTVHALIATDGIVSVSYTYDSWGNLLSVSGDPAVAAANRFTWQGREYSYATGLYSFRARWYDPAAGRWLSKDPIGLEGGLNLYEAFGNNPVNYIDPCGEDIADYDLDWVYDLSDFLAGFGDTISIGATSLFRDLTYDDDLINPCSGWYKGGEWTGVIYDSISGFKGGAKLAGKKAVGYEFSHWIPDRILKRTKSKFIRESFGKSIWNGNYVSPARHYAHDPYRFPKGWKNMGNRFAPIFQQLDRIPRVLDGIVAGVAAGMIGKSVDQKEK